MDRWLWTPGTDVLAVAGIAVADSGVRTTIAARAGFILFLVSFSELPVRPEARTRRGPGGVIRQYAVEVTGAYGLGPLVDQRG